MGNSRHVLPLYTAEGRLHGIMLSPELWEIAGSRLEPVLQKALNQLEPQPAPEEPMQEWQDFLAYWDFRYPVEYTVECKHCGVSTPHWIEDAQHPFLLKSAQLGGLVVFTCKACGSIVRKKHFKDHVCFEASPVAG